MADMLPNAAERIMHLAGHVFYRSANGVWLVEAVPAAWLEELS